MGKKNTEIKDHTPAPTITTSTDVVDIADDGTWEIDDRLSGQDEECGTNWLICLGLSWRNGKSTTRSGGKHKKWCHMVLYTANTTYK